MKTLLITLLSIVWWSTTVEAASGILSTKHNLSSWGPGEVKALTEDRVCIFCHTPHNATPLTPLWNRAILEGTNYQLYDSSTLKVTLSQPTGASRLCLSCHDGTVGIGAVMSVTGGIAMTKELTARSTMLGTDLRDDHPFSFSYNDALPNNPELIPTPPSDLLIYSGGAIHCSTCHDPHDNTFGQFLAVDSKNSGLCVRCHDITGWNTSTHATSPANWNGGSQALNPWPWNDKVEPANQRHTVAENGCENCHVSHNAGGKQRLMKFQAEEDNCITKCHNGQIGSTDIAAEFQKSSRHHLELASIGDISGNAHDPTEDITTLSGHVECQDCHDPHRVSSAPPQMPEMVNGRLQGVSGIDSSGATVAIAQYEYEICFKCHSSSDSASPVVNRVLNTMDKRKVFDPTNQTLTPSFHPIIARGRNNSVPSLPSQDEPSYNVNSTILCTSCHDSDRSNKIGGTGPSGPHGSIYSPILRQRYEMNIGASESFSTYSLCYRCHNRDNILSDASFQKNTTSTLGGHSRHLLSGGGTPCSVCHDPHGVYDTQQTTGSHTNLINFDTTVVLPVSGQTFPLFTDTGAFSGTCTLVCHGVTHDGSATYSYP